MKYKDISGQKFGQLTALYKLHNYHKTGSYWLCVCDCGNFTETYLGNLTSGKTHGKRNTRIYSIWCNMKARCYNKNHEHYKYYGERGIKLCDEWRNNFQTFYDWAIKNGYKDNLTIDRINVDGDYEPSNCRWANMKQQARNTRHNRYITIDGKTRCLSEWCEILSVSRHTVYSRLRIGQPIEKALGCGGLN